MYVSDVFLNPSVWYLALPSRMPYPLAPIACHLRENAGLDEGIHASKCYPRLGDVSCVVPIPSTRRHIYAAQYRPDPSCEQHV